MSARASRLAGRLGGGLLAVGLAGAILVGLGANRAGHEVTPTLDVPPATRVIGFEDSVGLFDTSSGEIYRMAGRLDSLGALEWRLAVGPVPGETSGVLELQHATFGDPSHLFAVDKLSGDTWLLRRRGGEILGWQAVPIRR